MLDGGIWWYCCVEIGGVCWGGCFTVKIAVVLVKNCCLVVVKLVINKAFGRIQLVLKLLRPLSR